MIKNADHRRTSAVERATAWNEAHVVGTYVRHWQSLPARAWMVAPTTSPAFVHGNGAAVHVMGARMPIYLSNLEPLSAAVLAVLIGDEALEVANKQLAIVTRAQPYLSPAAGGERDLTRSPQPAVRMDCHQRQLPIGDRE